MRATIRHRLIAITLASCLATGLAACNRDEPEQSASSTVQGSPKGDSASPTTASTTPADTSAQGCSIPDGDQAIPKTAPAVDEWTDVKGVGVPTSKTYGPAKREGDVLECYAHSPTGALFASAYSVVASGYVEGFADLWTLPGAQRERYKASEQKAPSTLEGMSYTIRGYRIASASADKFSVDFAVEVSTNEGTALTSIRQELVWAEGGWKLDPDFAPTSALPLSNGMEGFVPWSANG